jgi:hypothetical protein
VVREFAGNFTPDAPAFAKSRVNRTMVPLLE